MKTVTIWFSTGESIHFTKCTDVVETPGEVKFTDSDGASHRWNFSNIAGYSIKDG